jgi:hypothetical protein
VKGSFTGSGSTSLDASVRLYDYLLNEGEGHLDERLNPDSVIGLTVQAEASFADRTQR